MMNKTASQKLIVKVASALLHHHTKNASGTAPVAPVSTQSNATPISQDNINDILKHHDYINNIRNNLWTKQFICVLNCDVFWQVYDAFQPFLHHLFSHINRQDENVWHILFHHSIMRPNTNLKHHTALLAS